jgi:hypothetical protein
MTIYIWCRYIYIYIHINKYIYIFLFRYIQFIWNKQVIFILRNCSAPPAHCTPHPGTQLKLFCSFILSQTTQLSSRALRHAQVAGKCGLSHARHFFIRSTTAQTHITFYSIQGKSSLSGVFKDSLTEQQLVLPWGSPLLIAPGPWPKRWSGCRPTLPSLTCI